MACATFGCAAAPAFEAGSGGAGGTGSAAQASASSSGDAGVGGSFSAPGAGAGAGGTTAPEGDIYVHSFYTLYKFEPLSGELSTVGPFDCIAQDQSGSSDSGMHDIALDKNGSLFGVAKVGGQTPDAYQDQIIVSIDKATGHCTKELVVDKNLLDPTLGIEIRGLSFVPQGTIDPGQETLIALEIRGTYLRIDLARKKATVVGSLNGNGSTMWQTKGADVVSIIGDKTYVTAQLPGDSADRLAIMDPKTGQITTGIGPTGLGTIGGLAYWGGTLYAFTTEGRGYSIDPATAKTTEIFLKNAPSGVQYHGAGVTTAAPLKVPK